MFNNLTEKLNSAFHILKGHGKITEINVAETLKEVRRALLDADVSLFYAITQYLYMCLIIIVLLYICSIESISAL